MPAESLQLLCQASRKRAVASLNSDSDKIFANPTAQTIIPLQVGIVTAIPNPTGQRLFQPQLWTGWTDLKAGIGNPNAIPVAGTWYLLSGIALTSGTLTTGKRYRIIDFNAGDNFTNVGGTNVTGDVFTASGTTPTTWSNGSELQEATADLDFDATSTEVATALNATAWIAATSGVTVSGATLRFLVTFLAAGTRTQMVGFQDDLAPLSIVEVATLIDGTADVQEVQTVSVYQNVAALVLLSTNSDPADVVIDELQAGGGGFNQKDRITLLPLPYDGSFTLTIDNGSDPSEESDFIPWDASAADMVDILSPMTAVGEGNIQVVKEDDGQWLIMFIGDLADTAVTVTGDASALQVIPYRLGTLNLDTAGIQLLLNGATTVSTFMAITGIPPGESYPQEILRLVITLQAAVIGTQNSAPDPFDVYVTLSFANATYAPIASPTFTGVPAAPTAADGTNTTQLATTAFVQGPKLGTATNNSAAAGYIGQYIESKVAAGAPVSIADSFGADITSISLTAGDWDVDGNVNFILTGTTETVAIGGVSATSATLPTDGTQVYSGLQTVTVSATNGLTLARKRISIAMTTTIYLVGYCAFSAGTVDGFGSISARRVR